MLDAFREADAELKIVIAGNHDITLDESFYGSIGESLFHPQNPEDLGKVREMWTGWEAKQAGIIYLDEGMRRFQLKNGATFTVSYLIRFDLFLSIEAFSCKSGSHLRAK